MPMTGERDTIEDRMTRAESVSVRNAENIERLSEALKMMSEKLVSGFASIQAEMTSRSRTNWPVILGGFTGVFAMVVFVAALHSAAENKLENRVQRLEECAAVNERQEAQLHALERQVFGKP